MLPLGRVVTLCIHFVTDDISLRHFPLIFSRGKVLKIAISNAGRKTSHYPALTMRPENLLLQYKLCIESH